MTKTPSAKEAFIIQILSRQHSTWQGTVTWTTNQQTQSFRSLLELVKLIDSVVEDSDQTEE